LGLHGRRHLLLRLLLLLLLLLLSRATQKSAVSTACFNGEKCNGNPQLSIIWQQNNWTVD
jgi:hypothetical protein